MDELRLLYLVQDKFDTIEISVKPLYGDFWVYLTATKDDNVLVTWGESLEVAVTKLVESVLAR